MDVKSILYFGEKRVVLKGSSRISRTGFLSELSGNTNEMEGEVPMEKRLRVFRARSRIFIISLLKSLSHGRHGPWMV